MVARAQVSALGNADMGTHRYSSEIVNPSVFADPGMIANL
jgi:hypothetical protein